MTTTPPPQLPPAGWYPDPEGHGQRWWDGIQWTEHIQAERETPPPPSAAAVPMPMPTQAMSEGSDRRGRIAVAIAAVVLIGAIAVAVAVLSGRASSERQRVSGERAKAELNLAQTIMETYATEDGGSYAGVTVAALQAIEPTIPDDLEVTTTEDSYVLTIPAEDDNSFTTSRDEQGSVSYTCENEGEGGCPYGGEW